MVSIPPSWRPFASLPLRLVVGAALAVAGFVKVFSTLGQANIVYELSALAVPFPGLLGWVVGIAELLCGLALVVGMRTVAASVIMLMNLGGLVALGLARHIDYPELLALDRLGFPYRLPSYEAAAVLIAALLALVIGGPGPLSIDHWRASRRVASGLNR